MVPQQATYELQDKVYVFAVGEELFAFHFAYPHMQPGKAKVLKVDTS